MGEVTVENRFRGCLFGGAVGDALGADVEFMSTGEIRARYGPDGVTDYTTADAIGRITDDTQMTLFTAEGLIRAHNRMADRGICDVVVRIPMSGAATSLNVGVAASVLLYEAGRQRRQRPL